MNAWTTASKSHMDLCGFYLCIYLLNHEKSSSNQAPAFTHFLVVVFFFHFKKRYWKPKMDAYSISFYAQKIKKNGPLFYFLKSEVQRSHNQTI